MRENLQRDERYSANEVLSEARSARSSFSPAAAVMSKLRICSAVSPVSYAAPGAGASGRTRWRAVQAVPQAAKKAASAAERIDMMSSPDVGLRIRDQEHEVPSRTTQSGCASGLLSCVAMWALTGG